MIKIEVKAMIMKATKNSKVRHSTPIASLLSKRLNGMFGVKTKQLMLN